MSSPPAAPGADLRPQSACAKLLSSATTTTPQPRNDNEAQTTEDFDDVNNNNSNGNGNDVGVGSSSSSTTTNSTSSSSSSLRASSVSLSSSTSASGSGDGNGNPVTWRGRPSWLAEAGRPPAEELRARRKTDPCDYRAELLWQPYDCRSRSSSPEGGGGAAPHHRHLQPPPSLLQCAGDSGRAGTMAASVRTFTSTEAQTDDLPPPVTTIATPAPTVTREQRRRERRQRRRPQGLPDILHSHLPPPYSTLPLPVAAPVPVPVVTAAVPPPPPPQVPPPVTTTTTTSTGIRFPFQISPAGRRRSRRHYTGEEEPKSCCGVVVTQTVSIRWFIVMIAFVGVCCAVVGTVLGAMKASGREHLTVSLLMIGVGVVLVTVSAVAWRLTAHDAPSCRSMLGLGGGEGGAAEPNRRFVPRLPPSYGRPHHPYAAMMYPEFQYRAPPPSYQASMQEYRLRLLLLDRAPPHAVSPPPTYRSNSGSSTLRAPLSRDQHHHPSRPPSYRSRATVGDAPATDDSESTVTGAADGSAKLRLVVEKDHNSHHNLVTIVQTDDSPVIVTVSGSTPIVRGGDAPSEMEILAHL